MTELILIAIILLGGANLLRIALLLIATDIHEVKEHKLRKRPVASRHGLDPWLSVIIPAYNEELSIESSLASVCANTYPHFEVIVVDDGSKDATAAIVRNYMRTHPHHNVNLVCQSNSGKAHALNNAISNHAHGSLVMCLDADSLLAPDAIEKTIQHFLRNPRMVAMASNVHVTASSSLIGIMQKFEYLLSYRLKRALNVLKSEYIIGGVGSTFDKAFIESIGLYDTDTMTEDIDLTMKIIAMGNIEYQLGFGYDVHTYTQGVQRFDDLIKQRFRWKYGRMQSFIKNRKLFFNRDKRYTKTLTMFQLPYALFGEFSLFIEPLFVGFIFLNAILYADVFSLGWILGFMIFYMGAIILNDREIPLKQRALLMLYTPLVWTLFYVLTIVEFCALMKCLIRLPKISKSMSGVHASRWDHVERVAM